MFKVRVKLLCCFTVYSTFFALAYRYYLMAPYKSHTQSQKIQSVFMAGFVTSCYIDLSGMASELHLHRRNTQERNHANLQICIQPAVVGFVMY